MQFCTMCNSKELLPDLLQCSHRENHKNTSRTPPNDGGLQCRLCKGFAAVTKLANRQKDKRTRLRGQRIALSVGAALAPTVNTINSLTGQQLSYTPVPLLTPATVQTPDQRKELGSTPTCNQDSCECKVPPAAAINIHMNSLPNHPVRNVRQDDETPLLLNETSCCGITQRRK